MSFQLVALDLDGTVLDKNLQIRPATIEALKRVREQGVGVMLVTGRHHVATYAYWHQLELELPAICCNGTYVYDFNTHRPLTGNPLTRGEARQLLALLRKHSIYAMVYVDDAMTYETESHFSPNIQKWSLSLPEALRPRIERVDSFEQLVEEAPTIWKFTTASDDAVAMRAFATDIEQTIGLSCEWSGNERLDIARAGNSKGKRLLEWAGGQGIAREAVIAFGDQQNDMEMLRVAGLGVAMGNSLPEVQACADWIAGSNESDAIADTLRRFVLTPK